MEQAPVVRISQDMAVFIENIIIRMKLWKFEKKLLKHKSLPSLFFICTSMSIFMCGLVQW